MQYTIRAVSPKLDAALRSRAKETGKSLNEILLDALAKGAGVMPDADFTDMDWFIGGKSLDSSFDQALDWLDGVPKDLQ